MDCCNISGGKSSAVTLEIAPAQRERVLRNLEINCQRNLPQFQPDTQSGRCLIVGGGPSINDHVKEIKRHKGFTFGLNSSVDWMIHRGIRPDACVMMEIDAWPEEMRLRSYRGLTYYLSSFAAPRTYERLAKGKIVQWHADTIGMDIVQKHIKSPLFLEVLNSAAPTSIILGLWMGFRDFEAYGVDCSFFEQSHAYEHVDEDKYQGDRIEVGLGGKMFTTTNVLWRQARQFIEFHDNNRGRFRLRIHGDGLLPFAHRMYFQECY